MIFYGILLRIYVSLSSPVRYSRDEREFLMIYVPLSSPERYSRGEREILMIYVSLSSPIIESRVVFYARYH